MGRRTTVTSASCAPGCRVPGVISGKGVAQLTGADLMLASSPGPLTFELSLEGEAQERPHDDNEPEHADTRDRRGHRNGPDDIGADEDLQSNEDRPAECRRRAS